MWGTTRALVASMVKGVSEGYSPIDGDHRHRLPRLGAGQNLVMNLGFSHDVVYPVPDGIKITCERPTAIKVEGVDKRQVGQVASEIRASVRPSRTRARACATPTRRSAGRKARRSERQRSASDWTMSGKLDLRERRRPACASICGEGRRAAASFRVPLRQAHLRASDRRRGGTYARRRVQPRQDAAREFAHRRGQGAAAAVGKLVAERAVAAGLQRSCSIAAPISITAGSRRWPTPPAKAGWRSEGLTYGT